MTEFMNLLHTNYNNVIKMTLFNHLKTGNSFYDTLISTLVISLSSYIINYIYTNNLYNFMARIFYIDIQSFLFTKHTIILEGKRSLTTGPYVASYNISSMYSNRFKAIWNYIIANINKNNTIHCIKEFHTNYQASSSLCDDRKQSCDMYMVYQDAYFILDTNIYIKAVMEEEDNKNAENKSSTKIDKITIYIYSYVYSIDKLKNYIDNITNEYLSSIKTNRFNKRYIYSLNSCNHNKDEDNKYSSWSEELFESSRTFNNIFFDGKIELLEKINFFLNNREWYFDTGIPYSLGIGLHGPPGTGKTSFIKALANFTKRHIIYISLKLIKTKQQLEQFFFENTYNSTNDANSITFDKKIIVFEDIDCIGDVVLDRNRNKNDKTDVENIINFDNITVGNVLKNICNAPVTEVLTVKNKTAEDPITLDDILNLWDGIRETPGRILIITSNFYNKLDPALIRPGRIDITQELTYTSHKSIAEMYLHLFKKEIDQNMLKKVNELFYSPAEIINIYVSNKTEDKFMERLLQNKHV